MEITFILLYTHWPVTVPVIVVAFFCGWRIRPILSFLPAVALMIVCAIAMPAYGLLSAMIGPGGDALVYGALGVAVPLYIITPYALGLLMRWHSARLKSA
ncbi:hypothetical protein HY970_03970 [Candidatus Kaiserbacteria bacterium]|nr:hypothetical protein [Candidatus Kaiserbacteria bacterium]